MYDIRFDFLRDGKAYFGIRRPIELFGVPISAYVFLDKNKALRDSERYRQKHSAEYEAMSTADRAWCCARFGFFILISNAEKEPADILVDYISRVSIESIFKVGKAYLDLLPLSKWTVQRVRGKILEDIIATTIRCQMYAELPTDRDHDLMDWFHSAASVTCRLADGELHIEAPNKQAREAFEHFGVEVPVTLNCDDWKRRIMNPGAV